MRKGLSNTKGTIQMSFSFLVMVILGGLMLTVGVKYISKMASSIMGMSDEVSDTMRERILNDIKTKNEKVMLSIPTSIKMTRKEARRDISVVINNIDPKTKCYCVFAHLLNLDGTGSTEAVISSDGSGGLQIENPENSDFDSVSNSDPKAAKIKRFVPQACFEEGTGAECAPNSWFVGESGIKIMGEQANDIKLSLEIPRNPVNAPNGRYAFKVDVCEFIPADEDACDACFPENCRQNPINEDTSTFGEYKWYDSSQFHLKVFSEE